MERVDQDAVARRCPRSLGACRSTPEAWPEAIDAVRVTLPRVDDLARDIGSGGRWIDPPCLARHALTACDGPPAREHVDRERDVDEPAPDCVALAMPLDAGPGASTDVVVPNESLQLTKPRGAPMSPDTPPRVLAAQLPRWIATEHR